MYSIPPKYVLIRIVTRSRRVSFFNGSTFVHDIRHAARYDAAKVDALASVMLDTAQSNVSVRTYRTVKRWADDSLTKSHVLCPKGELPKDYGLSWGDMSNEQKAA